MTALKYRGYTETTVEKREICLAELKLHIINGFNKGKVKEMRAVCLDDGTVEVFHSIEDVLENNWNGDCKIEVINLAYKYGVTDENENFDEEATVILFQTAEDNFRPI